MKTPIFTRLSRLGGPLLGAAAAGYELYRLGNRAAKAISSDPPFASTTTMPVSYRPKSRRRPRRMPVVRYNRSLRLYKYQSMVRSTNIQQLAIVAGQFNAWLVNSVKLNQVKHFDLIEAYDLYRIKRVDLVLVPTYDPALTTPTRNNQMMISVACDPTNPPVPSTMVEIGGYDNHRSGWLTADSVFVYKFYPKATNTVDNAGTSQPVGSYSTNPWLRLSTAGVDIPHFSLVLGTASVAASPAAPNEFRFSYYYRIHFDVKNVR